MSEHQPVTDYPAGHRRVAGGEEAADRRARVVIVHGFNGYPEKHWFPWLSDELVAAGHPVTRVALPDPTHPHPGAWRTALAEQAGSLDGALVVGHSLGCITVLSHLENHPGERPLGLVFVAGFDDRVGALPELDDYIGDGVPTREMRPRLGEVAVVMSDGDHIVPNPDTAAMAERLGVEPVVVPGAKHFLYSDGVTEVPEVRDAALRILSGATGK